jgi:SAM-dependent methyltransferase
MTDKIDPNILSEAAAYYAAKFDAHGPTALGVDWNGQESHRKRHRQFLRLLDSDATASVIDLGCGFGDFFSFLREHGHHGRFIGYDIVPTMIEQARKLHGEASDRQWRVGAEPVESADYAIASGIFNVRGTIADDVWSGYLRNTLDLLASTGRRGFAFNVLSLSSDPERRQSRLYYADPVETLNYCLSRYGRSVALLQDYGLHEFTVLVRKPA